MSNQVQKIENTNEILSREKIHCPSQADVFERFISASGLSRVEAERMVRNIDGLLEVIVQHQIDQTVQRETELWEVLVLNDLNVDIFVSDRKDDYIPPGFMRYKGIGDEEISVETSWTVNKDKKRRGFLQRIVAALFG